MMIVKATALKNNLGKYLKLAMAGEDVYVERHKKIVAVISGNTPKNPESGKAAESTIEAGSAYYGKTDQQRNSLRW